MILSGPRVELISAVGEDWNYIFSLAKAYPHAKCVPELLPESARRHTFVAFVVYDRMGQKLGVVFSNHLPGYGFTVDLFVDEGNSGYIPECFDLFAGFMAQFTDRLYGYVNKGDERMLRLGEVFGFTQLGEAEGYVITSREI
jgi:hypothetical protein